MNDLRVTAEAERDLGAIWEDLETNHPSLADKIYSEILQTLQLLARYPGMGTRRPHYGRGLRGFPVSKNVIIYKPISGVVIIVRVLPGMMDIPTILKFRRRIL